MKKSTMAVATLLTVLSAPVASVAYADEAPAPAAATSGCQGNTGAPTCAGAQGNMGTGTCAGAQGCQGAAPAPACKGAAGCAGH